MEQDADNTSPISPEGETLHRRQFGISALLKGVAIIAGGSAIVKTRKDRANNQARKAIGRLEDDEFLPDSARQQGHYTFSTLKRGYIPATILVDNRRMYVTTEDGTQVKYDFPWRLTDLDIECPAGVEIILRNCTLSSVSVYPEGDQKKTTTIRYIGKTSSKVFYTDDNIDVAGEPVPVSDKGVARK